MDLIWPLPLTLGGSGPCNACCIVACCCIFGLLPFGGLAFCANATPPPPRAREATIDTSNMRFSQLRLITGTLLGCCYPLLWFQLGFGWDFGTGGPSGPPRMTQSLSLIHISEPTRLGMISY